MLDSACKELAGHGANSNTKFNMPPPTITTDKNFQGFCQEIHIIEHSQLITEGCGSMDALCALHEEGVLYLYSTPVSWPATPLRKRPWLVAATLSSLSR